MACRDRVVTVANSCGVSAVQRWMQPGERHVACAFLVAPPDPEQPDAPTAVSCFGPMGGLALPFPGLVVASSNDPAYTLSRAKQFARGRGARFVDVAVPGTLIPVS